MDKASQIKSLIREYNNIQQEIQKLIQKKAKSSTQRTKIMNEMLRRRDGYEQTLRITHGYSGPLDQHVENISPLVQPKPDNSLPTEAKPTAPAPKPTAPAPKPTAPEPKQTGPAPKPNTNEEQNQPQHKHEDCEVLKEPDTENRKEITLAGDVYYFSYTDKAKNRRRIAFSSTDPMSCLTEEEKKLLKKINLTDETLESVKSYMADFFEALPKCHSSVQMMTSKDCEIPNYIMWSVLLKARHSVQKDMAAAGEAGLSGMNVLQKNAQIKTLKEINPGKKTLMGTLFSGKQTGCSEEECKKIAEGIARIETLLKPGTKGGALAEMQRLYNKNSAL
jgi:hypothetical protein